MNEDCARAREQLDAWALGALDVDELRSFEAHVESCDECSALADEARDVAHAVAFAAPLRQPTAALKPRVLAAAAVLQDVREGRRTRWWAVAAAAAALVIIPVAAWVGYLQMEMDDLNDRNTTLGRDATAQAEELTALRQQFGGELNAQSKVLEIVSRPDAVRTEMLGTDSAPDARGYYVWSASEQLGALDAQGMPQLPPGKAYQLWFIYEERWVNAGPFDVEADGTARMIVQRTWEGDYGDLLGFAVTVEPEPWADRRSGEPILASAGWR
jgi:hypothetical protein